MFARKLGSQSPVELDEISIPSANVYIILAVSSHAKDKFSVWVIAHCALHGRDPNSSDIDIPAMNRISLGHVHKQTLFIRSTVDNLHLGELDALLVP
jgi:hypothetical protein